MTAFDAQMETHHRIIKTIADAVDQEDMIKMIFLFSDVLEKDEYKDLTYSSVPNSDKLFRLVRSVLCKHQFPIRMTYNILSELLYFTKNYWLLKEIGTCKHLMKEGVLSGKSFFVSEFMRLLVSLADELLDEEVNFISQRLHADTTFQHPVHLLYWMVLTDAINKQDVKILNLYFGVLERTDLICLTEEYMKKTDNSSKAFQYDMTSKPGFPCGIALVFNFSLFNEPPHPDDKPNTLNGKLGARDGTDKDATRLKALWDSFGIATFVYNNCKSRDFKRLLSGYLKEDLSYINIFILCILTHGEEGIIYCSDNVPIWLSDIEQLLGTSEKLAGKPKLMFIQACQGNAVQTRAPTSAITKSYQLDSRNENEEVRSQFPQYSDMLIGTATVPGFMSIRSTRDGTHFIQTLVDVLETSGDQEDISLLVPKINHKVTKKLASLQHKGKTLSLVQMPTFRNQLTKGLKFVKCEQKLHVVVGEESVA